MYIKMAEGHSGVDHGFLQQFLAVLSKGSTILELGSGAGTDAIIMHENGMKVTATDYSPAFVEIFKEEHKDLAEEIPFVEADATKLEEAFDGTKFDAIYSSKVLHQLDAEQVQASLKSQKGMLNDGGFIFHSWWLGEDNLDEMMEAWQYKESSFLKWIEDAGFEVLQSEQYKEMDDSEENDSAWVLGKKK
eukprot:TRINITY_DN5424_c0_g1_i1.p1 TRINITY_DN5424_c0_g1~~TRINITY_DN5424_c0_g1_i1.p1  ORF type:complete len:190 (-),score=69.47 TRINITY_DN5424_c0_g1_i1:124-693(-)